jgi:hypothetical protein
MPHVSKQTRGAHGSASERIPRLPVATARDTLSPPKTSAEPIDPSAAIRLTELEVRVIGNPRKDYTIGGLGGAAQACQGLAA